MNLRLGHDLTSLCPSLHNGPGWRIGLWTHGCRPRCTDQCTTPHLLDPAGGHTSPVADVIEAVQGVARAATTAVEGVTILGGEPFEQAGAVARLLVALQTAGLSNMVYS